MSATIRFTRAQMLEGLRNDYLRTARARGMRQSTVLYQHALKNALIPVVTQMAFVLGGSVIVESIFGLPGVGRLIVDAIGHPDYPQIQADVLVLAVNCRT